MARAFNFGAGPGMLPEPVLREAHRQFLDYEGRGFSLLEASHRGPEVQAIMRELRTAIRELLALPENYEVLFCQGGARLQFAMVPMNLLGAGTTASYIVTGTWSRAAAKEAIRFGRAQVAFSGGGIRTPEPEEICVAPDASYCYCCDNETIHGVEFQRPVTLPDESMPLAVDMTSNFMTRPIDAGRFGLFFAAAQNDFGAAGLTVVVVRRDLLGLAGPDVPTLLNYAVYSRTASVPNTPPVFAIYISKLYADWIDREGGVEVMAARACERSTILYSVLDAMPDFYRSSVDRASRSRVNVVFRLPDEALTEQFLKEAAAEGLVGLAGHRTVGGCRATLNNAMPMAGVEKLAAFMRSFADRCAAARLVRPKPASAIPGPSASFAGDSILDMI